MSSVYLGKFVSVSAELFGLAIIILNSTMSPLPLPRSKRKMVDEFNRYQIQVHCITFKLRN